MSCFTALSVSRTCKLSQLFDYDQSGRLQRIRYDEAVSVSYVYGDDGHVSAVNFTAPGIAQGVAARDIDTLATGRVAGLTLGNGLTLQRTYNSASLLTRQQWGSEGTEYSYDANGNLTAQQGKTYSYDPLNRLVGVSGSHHQRYHYDNVGNRLLQLLDGSTHSLSYQTNSNRRSDISLDAAGYPQSQSGAAALQLKWNELGELTDVLSSDVAKAHYSYNGWSQRVAKVTDGSTILYDYNLQGQLVHSAVYSSDNQIQQRYYLWPGDPTGNQRQHNQTGLSADRPAQCADSCEQ